VAPTAVIIGNVEIAEGGSVWYGAVLRGDICPIRIGSGTNVQDGAILHGDEGQCVSIGTNVTIGHRAVIHGCKIEDNALVGIGAIVLDGALIGEGAIIGAGAVVSPGKSADARTLWMGVPAKKIRDLDESAFQSLREGADHYVILASRYLSESQTRKV